MSDFSCWFCKGSIEEVDAKAVAIEVPNLWFALGDYPAQVFYAHSDCARRHLSTAYHFDPENLFNPQ